MELNKLIEERERLIKKYNSRKTKDSKMKVYKELIKIEKEIEEING